MNSKLADWNLFLIVWYPHSGCRWLNRSLLSNHSQIATSEYFTPWLTISNDMILSQDRSSQVHKTRSDTSLAKEFEIVRDSVEFGRHEGIRKYFEGKFDLMKSDYRGKQHGGVLSPGAPEPLIPDLQAVFDAVPKVKIIHLVRNPINCFLSMKSRMEMDGHPNKIAASWVSYNSSIRNAISDNNIDYCLVKYEDLLADTEAELNKICAFIDVPFEKTMLEDKQKYYGRNQKNDLSKTITKEEENIILQITQFESANYQY